MQFIALKKLSYIAVTGWNRKITFYQDNTPEVFTVSPSFLWPTKEILDRSTWHSDDILSLDFCHPTSVATSSYNGDIIICNINSGEVMTHINPHEKQPVERQKRSIDKSNFIVILIPVLYLPTRFNCPNVLVSAGGDGIVRFWNSNTGKLLFEKHCAQGKNESIYAMAVNSDDKLYIGDSAGYLSIYNIIRTETEATTMQHSRTFRAHSSTITDIQLLPDSIVTSSSDCSVRKFSSEGIFLGIFGQAALLGSGNLSDAQISELERDSYGGSDGSVNSRLLTPAEIRAATAKKLSSSETLNESLSMESWFSRSIYANERFLNRHKRKPISKSKNLGTYLCHELASTPSLSLPPISK